MSLIGPEFCQQRRARPAGEKPPCWASRPISVAGNKGSSGNGAAKALVRFEDSTGRKPFKRFHREQAVAFKKRLAASANTRTGERLSKSTMLATMRELRAFFLWLRLAGVHEHRAETSAMSRKRRFAATVANVPFRLRRSAGGRPAQMDTGSVQVGGAGWSWRAWRSISWLLPGAPRLSGHTRPRQPLSSSSRPRGGGLFQPADSSRFEGLAAAWSRTLGAARGAGATSTQVVRSATYEVLRV
jgi:hypothetical protein